ncbi:MAG: exosortase C-terminal domain/associated protein EpsI [Thermoguttaceae bacterium]|jgi:EpsI family protein
MRITAVRLAMVAALVVLFEIGAHLAPTLFRPKEVDMPAAGLETIARRFGSWSGTDEELGSEQFTRSEAQQAVARKYRDLMGRQISFLAALYANPAQGLYHSPTNCYRSNGWTRLSQQLVTFATKGRPEITASLSTWEKTGDRVLVLYWYELGDHILFERGDLFPVQLSMVGRKRWPPMYKVLLETPASGSAQAQLLEFAGFVRESIGALAAAKAPAAEPAP